MTKIDKLNDLLEKDELHSAGISQLIDVIHRAATRLNTVTRESNPGDDQDIINKLKEVSSHLNNGLSILQELKKSKVKK